MQISGSAVIACVEGVNKSNHPIHTPSNSHNPKYLTVYFHLEMTLNTTVVNVSTNSFRWKKSIVMIKMVQYQYNIIIKGKGKFIRVRGHGDP
jgi:hypothetical protein